jgi:hypothetical protein
MKDIQVFVIKDSTSVEQFPQHEGYSPVLTGLERQVKTIGLDCDIQLVNSNELPTKSDSRITSIFKQNCLVHNNYLLSLVSINNIYPESAIMCGYIGTLFSSFNKDFFAGKLASSFNSYKLHSLENTLLYDLASEPHNLPPAYNISMNSRLYNSLGGYAFTQTPKGEILDNRKFILSLSKKGSVLYSNMLSTINIFSANDISTSNICKYFYELGFTAASTIKETEKPHFERFWKQFVESPECLDHRVLGNLTFDQTIPEGEKKEYAEKLAMVRCSYQAGLFEGLSGVKVL